MKKKNYIIDRYTVEVIDNINNSSTNVDIISIYTDYKGRCYIIEGKTKTGEIIKLYIPFSLVCLL